MNITDVIQMLKQFKSSTVVREQEVFRCMIHNLFDEYRFFHKYPEKELLVTGRLFGTLIQHQLVSSITLGIALRYVLEALRKDPEQSMTAMGMGPTSNQKMFQVTTPLPVPTPSPYPPPLRTHPLSVPTPSPYPPPPRTHPFPVPTPLPVPTPSP